MPRSRCCRSPTSRSSGTTTTPADPFGTHLCVAPDQIARIYSTSGTTGTPSYIPLTASDLDNWPLAPRGATPRRGSRPASGSSPPTTPALSQRGGARLLRPDRPHPHPDRDRQHGAPAPRDRSASARGGGGDPSYAAYLIEFATERGLDLRESSAEHVLVAGGAGRQRARLPGSGGGGVGSQADRGDGDRRHRRLALGGVHRAGWGCTWGRAASSTPS